MSMHFYVALLHYPVYDKTGKLVATAVTNVDVHDIARLAATYGVRRFYVVTPVTQQRELVRTMVDHWTAGLGADYNPRRRQALEKVRITADLAEAARDVEADCGCRPISLGTGANIRARFIPHDRMRRILEERDGAAILVLGTGWGLERSFLEALDYNLAPIPGRGEYNHLSVRSAAAILVDRLLGTQWEEKTTAA